MSNVRHTGVVVSFSPHYGNGRARIIGTETEVVIYADEFKEKILRSISVGRKISFNVRPTTSAKTREKNLLKAVNCVVEFEDDNFLTLEQISEFVTRKL